MNKYLIKFIVVLTFLSLKLAAQVGISKENPNSTLDVSYSLGVKIDYISTAGNHILGINNQYVIYNREFDNVPTSYDNLILPVEYSVGRLYTIKNASLLPVIVKTFEGSSQTMIIGNASGVTNYQIDPGETYRFIRSTNLTNGAWELTRSYNPLVKSSDITLYAAQLNVPHYGNINLNNFSSPDWNLSSVDTQENGDRIRGPRPSFLGITTAGGRQTIGFRASRLNLTYAYKHGILYDDNLLNEISVHLTMGNQQSKGISLTPSFTSIYNSNGTTYIKISVVRTDLYGINATGNNSSSVGEQNISYISNWLLDDVGAFINILLTRETS